MKVINNKVTPAFGAIPIARTKNKFKGLTTKIDLYELTKSDRKFIENLSLDTDFNKNLSKMEEFDRNRWKKVFDYTIESAQNTENQSVIAFSGHKPCGILSFFDEVSSIFLDAVCAIPQHGGKKVNLGGTTLIYQLFKFAESYKVKNITLSAVTDGPFDVISKYKRLGFKDLGMEGNYVKMSCNQYKIKEKLKELSLIIEYEPVKNPEKVNLEDLIV